MSRWGTGGDCRLAGDDQRHPRFVDQDEVGLVDDGVVERALDDVGGLDDGVVAEEVEAGLLRGDVRDVGGVGRLPARAIEVFGHRGGGEAEEPVGRAHPGGIAARQVVVGRQDVDTPARQRVERRRHHRHERLALAGRELREPALMEGDGGHHLDVERPHAERAGAGLAGEREHLGQQVVERSARGGRAAGRLEPRSQLGVGQPARADGIDAASWRR